MKLAGKIKFANQIPTTMGTGVKDAFTMIRDSLRRDPMRQPSKPLPVVPFALPADPTPQGAVAYWFGHSAFLLEIEGKRLLFDPMFADTPSPFPLFGGKRYSRVLPAEPERLPPIDAVVLSHDHYDHLDYGSILKLKDKAKRFLAPQGVGARLIRWGVDPAKVSEHRWWDEAELDGLKLVCTPARHFSGRGLFDRNSTLWCSWVVAGAGMRVFFSGDSGYGPHFKEIGEKFGPFDLTFMECGQYDDRWAAIHMQPEETVQAQLDLQGKLMIPVHWGAFTLAFHAWTDPIERVTRAARMRGVRVATPRIGEAVSADAQAIPELAWWEAE